MKYVVDEIINNIVKLENIETRKIKEIDKSLLPENISEGNILVEDNNIYSIDNEEEINRRKSILERFNNLKEN